MKPIRKGQFGWARATACCALLATLAAYGCNPGPSARRGAATGAVAGAALGAVVGHQSDRPLEGAAIGAAAGSAVGGAYGSAEDQERGVGSVDEDDIDWGDLMTESEKEELRARAGRDVVTDWGRYLTEEEKESLLRRSGRVGG